MADLPPFTLEQLQNVSAGEEKAVDPNATSSERQSQEIKATNNIAESARTQAVLDSGLSIGVKGGLAFQLENIRQEIEKHSRDFDTIYDFSNLMIQDRVVPPVIAQAKDIYTQDGDLALRLSGASYQIISQAKFSSVPPNWRGYLTFPKVNFTADFINSSLRPKGSDEKKLFKLAIADGWQQGIENADLMLKEGMDRLNRDIKGMMLFNQFVMEGKITMPIIASIEIPVTHDGNTMTVDNTLLRITKLPDFNAKPDNWRISVSSRPTPSRVFNKLITGSERK